MKDAKKKRYCANTWSTHILVCEIDLTNTETKPQFLLLTWANRNALNPMLSTGNNGTQGHAKPEGRL
jgi:hypothetical protein